MKILFDVKFVRPDTLEQLMPKVLILLKSDPKPGITIIK